MRAGPTPTAMHAAARAARKSRTSATTSRYAGFACIVCGSPCMCMRHTAASDPATTSMAPGAASAVMSLIIVAPRASASRITSGLVVSTETGTPRPPSASSTGNTRASSSSAGTGAAPGRLDSPPMSTRSAPSSTRRRARAAAARASAYRPPSKNESGVTLTIPITSGRSSASWSWPQRRTPVIRAGTLADQAHEAQALLDERRCFRGGRRAGNNGADAVDPAGHVGAQREDVDLRRIPPDAVFQGIVDVRSDGDLLRGNGSALERDAHLRDVRRAGEREANRLPEIAGFTAGATLHLADVVLEEIQQHRVALRLRHVRQRDLSVAGKERHRDDLRSVGRGAHADLNGIVEPGFRRTGLLVFVRQRRWRNDVLEVVGQEQQRLRLGDPVLRDRSAHGEPQDE